MKIFFRIVKISLGRWCNNVNEALVFDLTMRLAGWESTVDCEVRGLIARRVKARVTTGGGASMSTIIFRSTR